MAATKSNTRRSASTAADDGKVTLTLAHPIAEQYQTGLGLALKDGGADYGVGEEVSVTPAIARAIINAGFAQVDPEDPAQVAKALGISDEAAQQVVDQMLGENPPQPVPSGDPGQ